MEGKTCIVTGASSGIGKAIALDLARLGATVVLVARDWSRTEAALNEIKARSGNHAIEMMVADLSSMAEVRELARSFAMRHEQLDVLVNNAGVQLWQRSVTPDGYETTFAVNYLAPFLLTNLLLDTLISSAPARVVNTSSFVYKWGTINFDDLHGAAQYDSNKAYYQSKLAIVLFTQELARILKNTKVTANCFEPGMTKTDFARDFRGFYRFMSVIWKPFMRTPEKAAETAIYLATAPELESVSGICFENKREITPRAELVDASTAERLWKLSCRLVGLQEQQAPRSASIGW
jgi:NAD(P)-dependent dehydrogenase (short-subunit alcohol dehydrogenase family)